MTDAPLGWRAKWMMLDAVLDLDRGERLVAWSLIEHLNWERNEAWPSVSLIARETGLSRRTVHYALWDLTSGDRPLWERTGTSDKRTTIYAPIWENVAARNAQWVPERRRNLRTVQRGGPSSDAGGCNFDALEGAISTHMRVQRVAPEPLSKEPVEENQSLASLATARVAARERARDQFSKLSKKKLSKKEEAALVEWRALCVDSGHTDDWIRDTWFKFRAEGYEPDAILEWARDELAESERRRAERKERRGRR